jgi:prepilin-type N-terminal cleavage/methylation domain-containing protein
MHSSSLPSRTSPNTAGFSLLELIVVVTLLAVMMGAVAPMYQDSLISIRSERGVEDFLATLKHGQELAVAQGVEHRLYLDKAENAYALKRFVKTDDKGKKEFKTLLNMRSTNGTLPPGMTFGEVEAIKDKATKSQYITLYPTGACDYSTIVVKWGKDDRATIETKGRLGRFAVKRS